MMYSVPCLRWNHRRQRKLNIENKTTTELCIGFCQSIKVLFLHLDTHGAVLHKVFDVQFKLETFTGAEMKYYFRSIKIINYDEAI